MTPSWAREVAMKVKNKYLDGSLQPPAIIRVEDFLTPEIINSNYEEHLKDGRSMSIANFSEQEIERLKSTEVDDSFGKTDLNQLDMMRISDIANSMNVIEKAEIEVRKKLNQTVPEEDTVKENISHEEIALVESNMKKLFGRLQEGDYGIL